MLRKNTILVVGGAGYIGSVTSHILLREKYDIIIVDDLSTGHKQSIPENTRFYNCSTLDKIALKKIFTDNPDIIAIIHFAASIQVSESITNPSKYFYNNVAGSLNLIDLAREFNIRAFILSSTAAVYGNPVKIPITEDCPTFPINPYALSKLQIEQMLHYYNKAYNLNYCSLRYFNACGAYNNLGEDHNPESHLIPNAFKVALKQQRVLNIYGNKYDSKDGTAIRDFIHVEDIANAHILALEATLNCSIIGEVFNIGSGIGYTVQEVLQRAEKISSEEIPSVITAPRAGDSPILIASIDKIQKVLGWKPSNDLNSILKSAWEWHKMNPEGYQ